MIGKADFNAKPERLSKRVSPLASVIDASQEALAAPIRDQTDEAATDDYSLTQNTLTDFGFGLGTVAPVYQSQFLPPS